MAGPIVDAEAAGRGLDPFDALCGQLCAALRAKLAEQHRSIINEFQAEHDRRMSEAAWLSDECSRVCSQCGRQCGSGVQGHADGGMMCLDPGAKPAEPDSSDSVANEAMPNDLPDRIARVALQSPRVARPSSGERCSRGWQGKQEPTPEHIAGQGDPSDDPAASKPEVKERGFRTSPIARLEIDDVFPRDSLRTSSVAGPLTESDTYPDGTASKGSRSHKSSIRKTARKPYAIFAGQISQGMKPPMQKAANDTEAAGVVEAFGIHGSSNGVLGSVTLSVAGLRNKARQLISYPGFEVFFAFVILSNSCFLGVEVDHSVEHPDEVQPWTFFLIGHAYTLLFVVEVAIRIIAFGRNFFVSSDWGWNWLDFVIVVSSVVELVTDSIHKAQQSSSMTGQASSNSANVRLIRMTRIAKMIRLLRIARLLKFFRALRTLVYQIAGTLRSVFWALILMLLINYLFAMIMVQAVGEFVATTEMAHVKYPRLVKYWGTLPRTMYTLYKAVTGGVDWEIVALPLSDVHWLGVCVFLFFLSFVLFAVMNTVTGVFCQKAIEAAQSDHDSAIRNEIRQKVLYTAKTKELFKLIGSQEESNLSFEQFDACMRDERVVAYFSIMGLDHSDAWDLFKLLDTDSSGEVNLDEFVRGFMRLRGTAKSIDIAKLAYENKQMRDKLSSFMSRVEGRLSMVLHHQASITVAK